MKQRLLTALASVALFGASWAFGTSQANAVFTCVYANPGSHSACNDGMLTGGGYTPGWQNMGAQYAGWIINNTGGSRNIELWFANGSAKTGQTTGPIPAWGSDSLISPAGSFRNLTINNGAAWATTHSYIY